MSNVSRTIFACPISGQNMKRVAVLFVATVTLMTIPLIGAGQSVPFGGSGGSGVNPTISEVQVSPTTPAPGETVTVTPVIENLESSSGPFRVTDVAVRERDGSDELTRVEGLGNVAPDSTLEVPLSVEFDSAGNHQLRVILYGEYNGSESIQVEHPVTVTVADRDPQMDITTEESIDGVPANGTVELVNGLESEITNVEATVDGTGVEMIENRTILASVDAGESVDIPFRFRPTAAGEHELTVQLDYTVAGTTDRSVTYSSSIQTDAIDDDDIRLNVTTVGDSSDPDVSVEVQNFGNHEIEDVTVTATSSDATFGEAAISSIAAGDSQQVRLDTTLQQSAATADIRVDYEMGTNTGTATTTTTIESEQGRIVLTGLDVTREDDGRIRVSGSTSNVGSSDIDSVIVSIRDTDSVDPAFPNREYFVGTVPASDFVSFDVYARTDSNTSSIPLEISYTSGGETREQHTSVDISSLQSAQPAAPDPDQSDTGGFTGLITVGVGSIMLLVVSGVLVVGWKNRDTDDS